MEKLDLEAIEARASVATKGPWFEDDRAASNGVVEAEDGMTVCSVTNRGGSMMRNVKFIAHARQDIPALIARIRELEAQIVKWEGGGEMEGDRL